MKGGALRGGVIRRGKAGQSMYVGPLQNRPGNRTGTGMRAMGSRLCKQENHVRDENTIGIEVPKFLVIGVPQSTAQHSLPMSDFKLVGHLKIDDG